MDLLYQAVSVIETVMMPFWDLARPTPGSLSAFMGAAVFVCLLGLPFAARHALSRRRIRKPSAIQIDRRRLRLGNPTSGGRRTKRSRQRGRAAASQRLARPRLLGPRLLGVRRYG